MSADPGRRAFLALAAAAPFAGLGGLARAAATPEGRKLLILVELKGGNDGLNTVVPYSNPAYAGLRPRLAIDRDQVVKLTPDVGLHPSLAKLAPIWESKRLAIVQGLGYPDPNLSHFRSIEIWDTASKSDEYLEEGLAHARLREGTVARRLCRRRRGRGHRRHGTALGPRRARDRARQFPSSSCATRAWRAARESRATPRSRTSCGSSATCSPRRSACTRRGPSRRRSRRGLSATP